jgi:MerR family Zn(II)-responsive transcriptional regulator of zntA
MARVFTSGDLARETGETVRTVRFYEEQGLLHPVAVSEGGHRRYDRAALELLQLILDFRELGLSIPDIRATLAMRTGCRNAVEFRQLLRDRLPAHVAQARLRIERLRRLESELRHALSSVAEEVSDPSTVPCPCTVASGNGAPRIVRVLARTGECGGLHGANSSGPANQTRLDGEEASRSHA